MRALCRSRFRLLKFSRFERPVDHNGFEFNSMTEYMVTGFTELIGFDANFFPKDSVLPKGPRQIPGQHSGTRHYPSLVEQR